MMMFIVISNFVIFIFKKKSSFHGALLLALQSDIVYRYEFMGVMPNKLGNILDARPPGTERLVTPLYQWHRFLVDIGAGW